MKSILIAIRRALWERRSLLELSSLDDHQLQDIGFSRSQIPDIGTDIVGPAAWVFEA